LGAQAEVARVLVADRSPDFLSMAVCVPMVMDATLLVGLDVYFIATDKGTWLTAHLSLQCSAVVVVVVRMESGAYLIAMWIANQSGASAGR
jgi:hypothetical protein